MYVDESMLDVYIYESQQLLETMEKALFEGEKVKKLNSSQINEIFRAMHTIKGSSSIMEYEGMTKLAHTLEDMFSQIRDKGVDLREWPLIFDLAFSAVGFFNGELSKLLDKRNMDGDPAELITQLKDELEQLKHNGTGQAKQAEQLSPVKFIGDEDQEKHADDKASGEAGPAAADSDKDSDKKDKNPCYKLKVTFEDDCQMENIRAFGIVQSLKTISSSIATEPEDLNQDGTTEK